MPRRIVALALVALALAVPAGAQSFGRNKVHYGDFDFQVLETPHFDIYYYPAEHDASVEAGRLAERWYARLSRVFDSKSVNPSFCTPAMRSLRKPMSSRSFLATESVE